MTVFILIMFPWIWLVDGSLVVFHFFVFRCSVSCCVGLESSLSLSMYVCCFRCYCLCFPLAVFVFAIISCCSIPCFSHLHRTIPPQILAIEVVCTDLSVEVELCRLRRPVMLCGASTQLYHVSGSRILFSRTKHSPWPLTFFVWGSCAFVCATQTTLRLVNDVPMISPSIQVAPLLPPA